jgi:hypothetical protein
MRAKFKPLGLADVDGGPTNSGGRARKWDWMGSAALVVASGGTARSDSFTGQASIIDGDTLEIHGTRIRLWGIDAPESSKLCRTTTAGHTAARHRRLLTRSIHRGIKSRDRPAVRAGRQAGPGPCRTA